ncbi:hypothetical protein Tco_1556598 [Tanacetum coccineum]
MATMTENVIAAGSETRPPMLEKGMYDSWKTRIMLYIRDKENGEMLKDSVINSPYKFKSEITVKDTDGVTDIRREERLEDLKGDDKLRYDSNIKADRVKELMEGTEMTKQERECMLYDEFDKFTSEPGESIHSYCRIYAKLINDMNMIPMSMTPMQINTKPLALLANTYNPPPSISNNQTQYQAQPSEVCQPYQHYQSSTPITQQLIQSPPLQSYAPPVVQQPPTFQPDIGLAIPTFLPTDDSIASLNKAMIFLSHMAKQCIARKRVKDSKWFKDKMLLAQAQEAGVVLDEEQQDFLADSLEETNDCEDLQLQAIANFKTDHVDTYDSDYDEEATVNAIFMENLSPVGSLNDDTVAPRYDSDTVSEIVEIFLWYLDSWCSKHMTGHRDKLINFVSKFIRTIRFGNDHFAAIMGYGDL